MAGKTLYPKRFPVFIEGDVAHKSGPGVSSPGSEITLITESVPSGKIWNLLGAYGTCFQDGTMRVKINGVVVGSSRTVAGSPNAYFPWVKPKTATSGQVVSVTFQALSDTPPSDVETYLDVAETSI